MSTSLLYQSFGIRGYEYCRTDFFEGRVCFTIIEQSRERYRCPECGSAAVRAQGHKDRFLQTVPIGLKPTFHTRPFDAFRDFRGRITGQFSSPWERFEPLRRNDFSFGAQKGDSVKKMERCRTMPSNTGQQIQASDPFFRITPWRWTSLPAGRTLAKPGGRSPVGRC